MSDAGENKTAAEALRSAAAELLRRADELDDIVAASPAPAPAPAPLGPPANEDEAAIRLIVLDAVTQGRERPDVERELAEAYPGFDAGDLLDRFYAGRSA